MDAQQFQRTPPHTSDNNDDDDEQALYGKELGMPVTGTAVWAMPMWTQRMYALKGGLDHLGLASVIQDRILPSLSPGINVLTFHPRYWSFYTFIVDEFWARELPRTAGAFNRFMKRHESIFATSCLLCPEHGLGIPQVIGSERLGQAVKTTPESYDTDTDYLKNPRGGYAVYASAIADQGLIALAASSQQLRCDAPTFRGRDVAAAFRRAVAGTEYYTEYFDADEVPAAAVEEYATVACLCRLPAAPDRALLVDAFLHGGEADAAQARRATLRFVCDLAQQTTPEAVSTDAFRRLVYFRADALEDGTARSYTPKGSLAHTARRWRLYQLREYYSYALNRLLQRTVAWGIANDGDVVAMPLAAVTGQAAAADFSALAAQIGFDDPGLDPSQPFSDLLTWARDAGGVTGALDDAWDLDADVHEDLLYQWARGAQQGDDVTAAMLLLLTLIAARVWPKEMQLTYAHDWPMLREGGVRRLAMEGFRRELRTRHDAGASIADIGRWILDEYVLRQHNRVALTKLRDGDTFRLRLEAGSVRFFDRDTPAVMNDPRYTALATCVAELGWASSLFGADHELTPEGRTLVRDGDLPAAAVYAEPPA